MTDVVHKERQTLDPGLKNLLEREEQAARDFIYYGIYSTVIGKGSDRIEVNDSHDHRFTNPYGFLFHIGCFSQALGCNIAGTPEAADSWFMGYQWRIASCSECQRHLGWYFDRIEPGAENDFFYGLILDRIQYE